jgi:signal transduction histidine kinase
LVHNEGIAYETAARFYGARGLDLIADAYLRQARLCYLRWGATGKARELERRHPQLAEASPLAPAATVTMGAEQLDLISVAKASQAISGEIVRDTLVRKLLEMVLEQGGARRAYLILAQPRGLSVEAEASLEESGAPTSVLCSEPLGAAPRVPTSLVSHVYRIDERVILNDAGADAGEFAGDEAFVRYRPKSVLCLPIRRQATVVGLLYLENDLLAGAFTPDRLVALELLATQAAISLENALLMSKECAARASAEAAERRSAILAEVGTLLSESLDYERSFRQLARLCARWLADYCIIDVVEDREIRRLTAAHSDPTKEADLDEIRRRYPLRWDAPHPAGTVLRTGRPLLITEFSDVELRARCEDDEHYRLIRAVGTRSGLAVPLVARGQMLGVVTLGWARANRGYGQADLELVEDVARRAAAVIDNARAYLASQEAVRMRSEFLTVASHELNTPLTSLMLAIQHMRNLASTGAPMDSQAVARQLELLSRQGTRLTRLVTDLLDVSRLEAGRVSFQLAEVDLGALVREVVARFDADLARAQCSVSVAVRGDRPLKGKWDRSRIDRVATNLLANALKFGAGKPIEIVVEARQGVACLSVRDQGIGIEPGGIRRIFDRFERAASGRNYGGLGLGLYISKQIVEGHGGTIRCESRIGIGSTFVVELPFSGPE